MLPTMLRPESASLFRYRALGETEHTPMGTKKLSKAKNLFEMTPIVIQSYQAALNDVRDNRSLSEQGKFDEVVTLSADRIGKQRKAIDDELSSLRSVYNTKRATLEKYLDPDTSAFGVQRDAEIRASALSIKKTELLTMLHSGDFSVIKAFRGFPESALPFSGADFESGMEKYVATESPSTMDFLRRIDAAVSVLSQQRTQLDSYENVIVESFTPEAASPVTPSQKFATPHAPIAGGV